jgi:flavin-dependent dehydrogenase
LGKKISKEGKSIVIGGGIAGLLASRVLSEHFANVLLIERDHYPESAGPRNGTPQANHVHVLLMKGKQLLMDLFPNLERNLLDKGAHKIDLLADARYLLKTGWAMSFDSGMYTIACTRQLLEHAIRNEILTHYTNIDILEDTRVTGLVVGENRREEDNVNHHRTIVGITTVFQNIQRIIYGQLIVDASGRNNETPNWLEKLGFGRPPETKVNSYIGYATRQFRPRLKNNHPNWKVMIILTQPPDNPRMGIIYPAEKDLWWVGILGIGKTYPPTIEEGFLDFVQKLGGNEIYEAIKDADPVSQIYGYRENGSRRYHYEKMKIWPENFIAIGDSVSAFNPFYAQGITTAAIGATVLNKSLHDFRRRRDRKPTKDLIGFSKEFQKRIAKVNSFPWLLGTSEDLRWPTTEGQSPNFVTRLMQKYSNHVMLLGPKSHIATKSFFEMMHMVKSPLVLFHPKIILDMMFTKIMNIQRR